MSTSTTNLLQQTFKACFFVAEPHLGDLATGEIFQNSYRKILDYFPNLSKFHIENVFSLQFEEALPEENDILAFAVWMQQYVREFQDLMIGFPPIDITLLTSEINTELQAVKFYEFYHQAAELNY